VFIVHGVCEHSGRYDRLVAHLCDAGYAVSAFDLRGVRRRAAHRDPRARPRSSTWELRSPRPMPASD